MRRHHILIPLAALLAILPLMLHGCSCGHDLDFHLQSWLDAAQQLRHGAYPHWITTAAWNSGEPRFIFYPPLSWLLGATLTLLFPVAATPAIYTFLCLTAAGFAMYRLARHFTSPNAALIAAILYLANPYMLFNAFERTAYAELLAAAWVPLLFLAVLRRKPTIPGLAIPIALLWLTNAPAAVMGCYTLALLATLRLGFRIFSSSFHSEQSEEPAFRAQRVRSSLPLALTYIAGTIIGLALPAFYLIPAAYERRFVQIAMAIIENMRFQDNFLFHRTADEPHNIVLHTVSLLAVTLVAITLIGTIALKLKTKGPTPNRPHSERSEESQYSAASGTPLPAGETIHPHPATSLLILTLLIAFLLTPLSTPIWNHLPNLAFLQFPWRFLTILCPTLAFTIALLLNQQNPGGARTRHFRRFLRGPAMSLAAALALGFLCFHLYGQPCYPEDAPKAVAQSFNTHHGVPPTDEYTPNQADNDILRSDDPAYWLADDPQAFAPNTIPNPAIADPTFNDDIPPENTISYPTSHHFTVHTNGPAYLILNLRNYPNWDITDSNANNMSLEHNELVAREDGLIAMKLYYAADHTIDITWQTTPDQKLGYLITTLALLCLVITLLYSRHKSGTPTL